MGNTLLSSVRDTPEEGSARERLEPKGATHLCRRDLTERFVWPLLVVDLPEAIEAALLDAAVSGRRMRGLGLEGPVHALVSPVLLRVGRLDANGADPEAHSITH